jgi:hypothetical protein
MYWLPFSTLVIFSKENITLNRISRLPSASDGAGTPMYRERLWCFASFRERAGPITSLVFLTFTAAVLSGNCGIMLTIL